MSSELFSTERPAWISVILIFTSAFLGFALIGPAIGIVIASIIYQIDIMTLIERLASINLYPEIKGPYLIVQASSTLIGLLIIPSLYIFAAEKRTTFSLFRDKPLFLKSVVLTILIVITFYVPNSFFIDLNSNFPFPEFLKGFENWARELEQKAEGITKSITTFNSFSEFIYAFTVIAIFAGVCEEVLFRGILQPGIYKATNNIHAAIWISAILFSAFHLQFFGFIPRLLLGVLFGYFYYWSGNILVPILAHITNNGVQLIMIFLYQRGIINIDMESTEPAPAPFVVLFTIITFAALLYLKKFHREKNSFL